MDDALDLLLLETDLLFGIDSDGWVGRGVDVVVAVTPAGDHAVLPRTADLGFRPDDVVAGAQAPSSLTALRDELVAADGLARDVTGGPSYLVPVDTSFSIAGLVVTSTSPGAVRETTRPVSWQADEWRALLDGGAGSPWAVALRDGEVVSVCHTPRADPRAVEAGTWTDPRWRGRGLAAATTAAWAALFPSDTTRFYSTAAGNRSSQAVAARLNLRHLGWMWKVAPASFVG